MESSACIVTLMLRTPEPVLVLDLFPAERGALLALLESLSTDDWFRPTIAGDWTVKDIAHANASSVE